MEFQSIVRSLSASNAKVLLKIAQTTTNAFLFCALISFWTVIAHGVRNSTKSPTPCLHGWPKDGPLLVMASTNKALAATADQDAGPATRAHHQMGKAARRSHLPWHRGRGSVRRREFSELSWRHLPMRQAKEMHQLNVLASEMTASGHSRRFNLGNAGCPVLPVGMGRSYWLCPGRTRNPARRANQNGLGKFACPVPAAKIFYFARRANHF